MVDIFWLEALSGCARSLHYTLLIRRKKIQLSENRVEILEEEKESQVKETDDLERYSRRNCLFLHGFVETNDECTDDIIIKVCAEELGIDAQQ